MEHRNSVYNNCKKVFYTGENAHHDKLRTYAHLNLTFEPTSIHNNNIRLPLWILYGYEKDMMLTEKRTDKFCCFVQSKSINYRNNFCKKLSNYKRVDCGGGCLNNVGGKVKDKKEFQKKYKFCIAFENIIQPYYTTEKNIGSI